MSIVQHILFPVDFSMQGAMAAPYVRAFAQRFGAKVTMLSVVPPIWTSPAPGAAPGVPAKAAELELDFARRLAETMVEDFEDLAVERIVRSGDPALEIAAYALANGADLIMLPTHGYGMFRGLLIGSVAARVLHDAAVPVWTATHAEKQLSPHIPQRILCAVDGGDKSCALMKWAAKFSEDCGAELDLLHVVPRVSDWLALPGERALQDEACREALQKLKPRHIASGVKVPLRIEVGEIAATVADEARQGNAGLVIIARGAISGSGGRLRTHAYGIIHSSPCPVLSV